MIENGIDPELFRPVDRTEARRALGLPKYGPLLVSVGTLAERKGFHLVMEAMAKLGKRWPTLRFAIVGGDGAEGAMEGELRQLAARLKIADRVIFAGPRKREELARLVRRRRSLRAGQRPRGVPERGAGGARLRHAGGRHAGGERPRAAGLPRGRTRWSSGRSTRSRPASTPPWSAAGTATGSAPASPPHLAGGGGASRRRSCGRP